MSNNNKLIILCATQRCGSTMIVDDFRGTGVLGKPEEYFIPWTAGNIENPIKVFQDILKISKTDNNVSTIKVMADQLEYIERQLEGIIEINSDGNSMTYPRCRELFKDATFIRIDRIDSVSQATSRYIAKLTGKNHFVDSSSEYIPGNTIHSNKDYNSTITFDESALDEHVISIAKEKALWSKVMKEWGFEYTLSLSYEDCINDRSYLEKIMSNLDLTGDISERKIKKIGNEKNQEIIKKYISSTNKTTKINDNIINEIRDVGYNIWEKDIGSAKRLLKLVLKLRPNSPNVRKKIGL